jgi:hypothetical protein
MKKITKGEANGEAKKTAVSQTYGDVVTQMPARILFDFAEREHGQDFTSSERIQDQLVKKILILYLRGKSLY